MTRPSTTRGTLTIHSAAAALTPHITWTIQNIAHTDIDIVWEPQTLHQGSQRASLEWSGGVDTPTRLASSLAPFKKIWFEVTVEGTSSTNPGRWMYTPSLGITHVQTDIEGNFVLTEDRLKAAVEKSGADFATLIDQLSKDLAEPWDEELEPLREAGADRSNIVWFKVK